MSIIDSYDESEEIVKAEVYTTGQKRLPSIAITCFKTELIQVVKNSNNFEEYSELYVPYPTHLFLLGYSKDCK